MPDTPATPDPATGSAPASSRRRRRRWPRLLGVVAGVLVLALIAVGGYAWRVDRGLTSNINRGIDLPTDDPSGEARPTAAPETGARNYVLLGSDSRDPENTGDGRSDSIMVVHLNKERDEAYIVSFPRDMWVDIPGHGKNKINAAYSFGGPPLTVSTLEKLTDVRMDHLVLIGMEGFVGLTEDLGGVTVKNETEFSSHGFDYPEGMIDIQGERALWFVRERKSLPNGDLDRAKNQRRVIKAIVSKGLSAEVVADPARFTAFTTNLAQHLTVDNSLTDDEIRRTALSLRLRLKSENIALLQAPISGFATSADGQSIDVVDTEQLAELSEALEQDTMDEYVQKYSKG